MNLKEIREKRSATLKQASDLLTAGITTPEQRTQYDNMMVEVRTLGEEAARHEEHEAIQAEERARVEAEERSRAASRPNLPNPGTERGTQTEIEERNKRHREALARYISNGDMAELRAMNTLTGPAGGAGVPVDLAREIDQAILTFGGVAPSLRQLPTPSGETITWPMSDDVTNAATIITQGTAATETDITLSNASLNVSTLTTGIVQVSNQLLQDFQASDLSTFVQENMTERAARGLAGYIINGSSDTNFTSLLTAPPVGATTAAPTAVGLADITAIFGAVDPGYASRPSAKFTMHRTMQLYLASLRNSLGTPIFPLDMNGMLTKLYGQDVVVDQSMPALTAGAPVAAAKYIIFGDLHKYILRKVNGYAIQRLNERYAEFNQTAFVMFFRAGGLLLDAGTHPIQVLQQHA